MIGAWTNVTGRTGLGGVSNTTARKYQRVGAMRAFPGGCCYSSLNLESALESALLGTGGRRFP